MRGQGKAEINAIAKLKLYTVQSCPNFSIQRNFSRENVASSCKLEPAPFTKSLDRSFPCGGFTFVSTILLRRAHRWRENCESIGRVGVKIRSRHDAGLRPLVRVSEVAQLHSSDKVTLNGLIGEMKTVFFEPDICTRCA